MANQGEGSVGSQRGVHCICTTLGTGTVILFPRPQASDKLACLARLSPNLAVCSMTAVPHSHLLACLLTYLHTYILTDSLTGQTSARHPDWPSSRARPAGDRRDCTHARRRTSYGVRLLRAGGSPYVEENRRHAPSSNRRQLRHQHVAVCEAASTLDGDAGTCACARAKYMHMYACVHVQQVTQVQQEVVEKRKELRAHTHVHTHIRIYARIRRCSRRWSRSGRSCAPSRS